MSPKNKDPVDFTRYQRSYRKRELLQWYMYDVAHDVALYFVAEFVDESKCRNLSRSFLRNDHLRSINDATESILSVWNWTEKGKQSWVNHACLQRVFRHWSLDVECLGCVTERFSDRRSAPVEWRVALGHTDPPQLHLQPAKASPGGFLLCPSWSCDVIAVGCTDAGCKLVRDMKVLVLSDTVALSSCLNFQCSRGPRFFSRQIRL